jgi:hypothetical protein
MSKTETPEDFYRQKLNGMPDDLLKNLGHFNAFRIENHGLVSKPPIQYTRRDYYKISLIRGHFVYHYADKSLEVSGKTLFFLKILRSLIRLNNWAIRARAIYVFSKGSFLTNTWATASETCLCMSQEANPPKTQ